MSNKHGINEKLADILFDYQKFWVAVCIALTLGLGFFIKDLRIDNSVEVLFQKDSDIVRSYRKFTEIFGNAELAVVAFHHEEGVLQPNVLDEIERLTSDIENKVRHVDAVISLANISVLDNLDGSLAVRTLLSTTTHPTDSPAGILELKVRAKSEPFIHKTLISDDGKTTSIVVKTVYLEGNQTYRKEITDDLRNLLKQYREEYKVEYYLGGPPVFLTYFDEYILKDLLIFGPLTALVLFTILFLTFRSWIGVVLPMAVVGIGGIWTVGFMGMMGFPITLATTIIPPLLFVTGIEDAIYILSFFHRRAAQTDDARKRAWLTAADTNMACMLTSVTTAIGFGALMITDIGAVFETGMVCAVGALAVWGANNILLPIVLQKVPYDAKDRKIDDKLEHGLLLKTLDKLVEWNLAHPKRVLAFGLTLTGAFIPGLLYLKVETNFMRYFREDSPIFVSQNFIQNNLSGVAPLEVLVDTHHVDGMKNPQVLAEMKVIETELIDDPVVDWTFGTHDFIGLMHKYMTLGVSDATPGPITDPNLIGQYVLLYQIAGGGAGLEDFLSEDGRYGRISARLKDASTSVLEKTLANVESHFDGNPSGATYQFADNTAMLVSIVDAMLLNTMQSLLLAIGVIWVLILLYIRSFKVSMLFMIPNVIPVGAVLGLMGYTGIELNISTMMIGAVAIGLAVNNTIHIFAHFPHALAHANGNLDEAAHETMHSVGRAAISAGLALAAGFLVLSASSFYPNVYFGSLSAFTVAVAIVCDVTISYTLWIFLARAGYRGRETS